VEVDDANPKTAHCNGVYGRIVALEAELRELRALVVNLKPDDGETVLSRNPVALGGLWAGVELPDDLVEAG
jgi:hypothetical protein